MNIKLPKDFISRMRLQLGDELTAFLHALEEPPVRGIRMNPLKVTDNIKSLTEDGRVPWAKDGYYLALDSNAGSMMNISS